MARGHLTPLTLPLLHVLLSLSDLHVKSDPLLQDTIYVFFQGVSLCQNYTGKQCHFQLVSQISLMINQLTDRNV